VLLVVVEIRLKQECPAFFLRFQAVQPAIVQRLSDLPRTILNLPIAGAGTRVGRAFTRQRWGPRRRFRVDRAQ
jgi:hypothetical protein